MDRCLECGFSYVAAPPTAAAEEVAALLEAYGDLTTEIAETGRAYRRPAPSVWSPVEYLCHVRDGLRLQYARIEVALLSMETSLSPMRADELAITERYGDEDVDRVLSDLIASGHRLVHQIRTLRDDQHDRAVDFPTLVPSRRTVGWIVRHAVHEVFHHLGDIRRGLRPPA
ncbi:MAG TPA: DinB family protein [Micromonosporaceae bacterium]